MRAADLVIRLVLALGTVAYLHGWPHDLLPADEGLFLYEAKRILQGEVMYGDFFDVIAPVPVYAMALMFSVFGTSMETARLSMAALHAISVLLVYDICRRLAVRQSLAAATAAAYVVLSYPALPVASPHWFGTCLTLLLVRLLLQRTAGSRWCAVLGLATGLFLVVQHQKAIITAASVVLLIVLDEPLSERRWPSRRTLVNLAVFAAAVAAVSGPVMLWFVVQAGWWPVFDALVYHPLLQYRQYTGTEWAWGNYSWLRLDRYVFPELIRQIFVILPVTLVRVVWHLAWDPGTNHARALLVLIAVGTAAALSVLYNPGYTHVAMVVPICFIIAAETVDRFLQLLESHVPLLRVPGHAVGWGLCVALAVQAHQTRRHRWELYPLSHATAFGRIEYQQEVEIRLLETVRERLAAIGSRLLFCYTGCAGLYLTANAENPTRYQLLIPGYNRPEQFAEVLEVLERRQVPLVTSIPLMILRKAPDPIRPYLIANYQAVPFWPKRQFIYTVFQRNGVSP